MTVIFRIVGCIAIAWLAIHAPRSDAFIQGGYSAIATGNCPFGTSLSDGCSGAQASGTIIDAHAMDPQAVLDLNIVGGTGYTNGTFTWTSSGGGCSVAATGSLTVSGGILGGSARGANFSITNRGTGCTSRPTISIPAGAAGGSGGGITPTVYQVTAHNCTSVTACNSVVAANWNVAGVDYPIGYDTTLTLSDPTSAGLPSGCTFAGHTVTCGGSGGTLNGYDFNLHSTHLVLSASGWTVTNNKFGCGASDLDAIHINSGTMVTVIKYNNFNANSTTAGGCNLSGGQDAAISSKATGGSLTVEYNYCVNQDSKCISLGPSAASAFTDTIVEQYNYWQDMGGCSCGAHAEAEYTFSSLTLGANPVHTWTMQFNTMIIHYWYGPTNATSPMSIEADGSTIDTPNVQFNIEIARGTQSYTGSSNASGQSGSAANFCGAQESGGYTGTKVQKNNLLEYSGGFSPYNAGGSPGCAAVFTSLADFNLGTGNTCNTSTCN